MDLLDADSAGRYVPCNLLSPVTGPPNVNCLIARQSVRPHLHNKIPQALRTFTENHNNRGDDGANKHVSPTAKDGPIERGESALPLARMAAVVDVL